MRNRTCKASPSRESKVSAKATVAWPESLEEWNETGYDEAALFKFAFDGWRVKEFQPELRAALKENESLTDKQASNLAKKRLAEGWRERKKQSTEQRRAEEKEKKTKALRAAGRTEKEIEMYFALQAIAEAK